MSRIWTENGFFSMNQADSMNEWMNEWMIVDTTSKRKKKEGRMYKNDSPLLIGFLYGSTFFIG
jgi:hypothetical protein